VEACIKDGFTSVMIDGSHASFEENVKLSAAAAKAGHQKGVVVEAELGMLGGIEEHVVGLNAEEYEKNVEKYLTDPKQAADFWKQTGVDSLAIAIGTSHGPSNSSTKQSWPSADRADLKTCRAFPWSCTVPPACPRSTWTW